MAQQEYTQFVKGLKHSFDSWNSLSQAEKDRAVSSMESELGIVDLRAKYEAYKFNKQSFDLSGDEIQH